MLVTKKHATNHPLSVFPFIIMLPIIQAVKYICQAFLSAKDVDKKYLEFKDRSSILLNQ